MNSGQYLAGRFIVIAAAVAVVFSLYKTLSTGEVWLRGARQPYTRKNEPIRYWIMTTLGAILALAVVTIALVSNFTGHYFEPP